MKRKRIKQVLIYSTDETKKAVNNHYQREYQKKKMNEAKNTRAKDQKEDDPGKVIFVPELGVKYLVYLDTTGRLRMKPVEEIKTTSEAK